SAALATAPTNTKLVIHPPRTPGVDYFNKNVLLMPSGDLDLDPTRRKRLARSSEPKQGISRMTNLFGRALRLLAAVAMLAAACIAHAQWYAPKEVATPYGPYHARFLQGGEGVIETLVANDPILSANAPWTIHAWVRMPEAQRGDVLLGGFGDPVHSDGRYLALRDGKPMLWSKANEPLVGADPIAVKAWVFVAATFDGRIVRLFAEGKEVAQAQMQFERAQPTLQIAPHASASPDARHFGGELAGCHVMANALDVAELSAAFRAPPAFDILNFHDVAVGWPWQTRQQVGLLAPQHPATLPRSAAPFSKPIAKPVPKGPSLEAQDENTWRVAGWRLAAEPTIAAEPKAISSIGFDASDWYAASVPGTVLTTLIDRGIYPDPDFGLNNMAIPETLNKQHYWYRTEFDAPASLANRELTLTFKSINYAADVWLNGEKLGEIKGAFIRGIFDVTDKVKTGAKNVLAVKIYSPPHPGIPHEQSIKAGPGENGGALAIDGPTFVA